MLFRLNLGLYTQVAQTAKQWWAKWDLRYCLNHINKKLFWSALPFFFVCLLVCLFTGSFPHPEIITYFAVLQGLFKLTGIKGNTSGLSWPKKTSHLMFHFSSSVIIIPRSQSASGFCTLLKYYVTNDAKKLS